MPGVFPDYAAPIVRVASDGVRELATALGMPCSRKAMMDAASKRADTLRAKGREVDFAELLRLEPDMRDVGTFRIVSNRTHLGCLLDDTHPWLAAPPSGS